MTLGCLVTSWNYSAFLGEALASLDAQTVRPSQVVIVDDASTDRSAEIAGAWVADRPWARLVVRPERLGFVANANRGLLEEFATDWAFILSADDWIEPEFVGAHLEAIETADDRTALVYCTGRYRMTEPGAPVAHLDGSLLADRPWTPGAIQAGNYVHGSAAVRLRDFRRFGGFAAYSSHEDWMLWRAMDSAGLRGVHIPAVLLNYRHHGRGHRNFGTDHRREGLRG